MNGIDLVFEKRKVLERGYKLGIFSGKFNAVAPQEFCRSRFIMIRERQEGVHGEVVFRLVCRSHFGQDKPLCSYLAFLKPQFRSLR